MQAFELRLRSGERVIWQGADGPTAARRYADSHPGAEVLAWRTWPRLGLFTGVKPIVEPDQGPKETKER